MVTSDSFGVAQLVDEHHVAADQEEAARIAIRAGVDCEVPEGRCFDSLVDQARSGQITVDLIDRAVHAVLMAKQRLGLLDEIPRVDADLAPLILNNEKHRQLALEAAIRSATLLKNDGSVLPLDPDRLSTLAVIGPNAADLHLGGYSRESGRGASILEGIRDRIGTARVTYAKGCQISEGAQGAAAWWADEVYLSDPAAQIERIELAHDLAAQADATVLVIGGNEATAREAWASDHLGDRASLELPGAQVQLIESYRYRNPDHRSRDGQTTSGPQACGESLRSRAPDLIPGPGRRQGASRAALRGCQPIRRAGDNAVGSCRSHPDHLQRQAIHTALQPVRFDATAVPIRPWALLHHI